MSSPPALLRLQGVSKRFGGLQALDKVSLAVPAGSIHGLIGPNGAGKTSLFNTITGLYTADQGLFELNGHAYSPSEPHKVARLGIARTFQNIRLFNAMTVLENVMIGRHVRTRAGALAAMLRLPGQRREEALIQERAMHWLAFVGLGHRARQAASNLSYGDQRRLEIARALATDPLLLALDEPAAGMNPTEKGALQELLLSIRQQGTTLLLIEHDVKLVMGLCDGVTVLDHGAVIADGTPQDVQRHPAVIEAYLGTQEQANEGSGADVATPGQAALPVSGNAASPASEAGVPGRLDAANPAPTTAGRSGSAPALLSVKSLNVTYGGIKAVRDVAFDVMPGETVALIGSNGAGKSSTLNAMAGLVDAVGQMQFDGTDLAQTQAHGRVELGMALVPEGRGIFRRMTIHENLLLGAHHRRADKTGVVSDLQRMYALFPRLDERREQLAGNLSGGEQQMLAMARALMSRPRLLLLDEPSMGLAPIIVDQIFKLITDIAAQGTAILLVEQNARRALQISQRAYVMESGEITLSGSAAELLHDDAVRRAYLGDN